LSDLALLNILEIIIRCQNFIKITMEVLIDKNSPAADEEIPTIYLPSFPILMMNLHQLA
jgi:hypothetical protein